MLHATPETAGNDIAANTHDGVRSRYAGCSPALENDIKSQLSPYFLNIALPEFCRRGKQ